jgi:hypothetical protein
VGAIVPAVGGGADLAGEVPDGMAPFQQQRGGLPSRYALTLDPRSDKIRYQEVSTRAPLGEIDEEIHDYRKQLAPAPNDLRRYRYLALACLARAVTYVLAQVAPARSAPPALAVVERRRPAITLAAHPLNKISAPWDRLCDTKRVLPGASVPSEL